MMFGTGCRIGEVIGLRWDNVDMEKNLININHSVTYYPRSDLQIGLVTCLILHPLIGRLKELWMIITPKRLFVRSEKVENQ